MLLAENRYCFSLPILSWLEEQCCRVQHLPTHWLLLVFVFPNPPWKFGILRESSNLHCSEILHLCFANSRILHPSDDKFLFHFRFSIAFGLSVAHVSIPSHSKDLRGIGAERKPMHCYSHEGRKRKKKCCRKTEKY